MAESESNDEELFSMDELEKDLKRGRGGRRLPWFAAGLVLGIAGTVLVPRFAGPYLPDVFGGGGETLSGPVLGEERDGDRLLLTIETEPGALIASFSRRVAEIGLLVEPGDTVTISVPDYDPFVEDPDFEGVRKAHPPAGGAVGREDGGEALPSTGTAAARDTGAADSVPATAAPATPDSAPDSVSGAGADTAEALSGGSGKPRSTSRRR